MKRAPTFRLDQDPFPESPKRFHRLNDEELGFLDGADIVEWIGTDVSWVKEYEYSLVYIVCNILFKDGHLCVLSPETQGIRWIMMAAGFKISLDRAKCACPVISQSMTFVNQDMNFEGWFVEPDKCRLRWERDCLTVLDIENASKAADLEMRGFYVNVSMVHRDIKTEEGVPVALDTVVMFTKVPPPMCLKEKDEYGREQPVFYLPKQGDPIVSLYRLETKTLDLTFQEEDAWATEFEWITDGDVKNFLKRYAMYDRNHFD
jgi:hypothetical protein